MHKKRLMKMPVSPDALINLCREGTQVRVTKGLPEDAKCNRSYCEQIGLDGPRTIYIVVEHPSFDLVEDNNDSIPEILPVFQDANIEI